MLIYLLLDHDKYDVKNTLILIPKLLIQCKCRNSIAEPPLGAKVIPLVFGYYRLAYCQFRCNKFHNWKQMPWALGDDCQANWVLRETIAIIADKF